MRKTQVEIAKRFCSMEETIPMKCLLFFFNLQKVEMFDRVSFEL